MSLRVSLGNVTMPSIQVDAYPNCIVCHKPVPPIHSGPEQFHPMCILKERKRLMKENNRLLKANLVK
jgi:hypothetical protein